MRTQAIVAAVDAVGIGIGALILGLPLIIPIVLIVFIASFVPIVGAVLSGVLVVFIALMVKGWVTALIMLAIVIVVQQVESHLLQPVLMGRAVSMHPLAVILAVATGSFLLGVTGALFSVPVLAMANVIIRSYTGTDREPEDDPPGEEDELIDTDIDNPGPMPGHVPTAADATSDVPAAREETGDGDRDRDGDSDTAGGNRGDGGEVRKP